MRRQRYGGAAAAEPGQLSPRQKAVRTLHRRKLQLSLQRQFTANILAYCDVGAEMGDPDATALAREIDRLDSDERRERTLGPWTGGVTPVPGPPDGADLFVD